MLNHIGIGVSDHARSKAFYAAALAPLGFSQVMEFGDNTAFGPAGLPGFWIQGSKAPMPDLHVCFTAESRAAVRAFYEAAMAAGGRDNGAPGIVEEYAPDYYAAFVFDPDGVNVEALCRSEGE
jgi:catechol 2,3-dioxygenase-like lactoylglutathione lyase family enzyme